MSFVHFYQKKKKKASKDIDLLIIIQDNAYDDYIYYICPLVSNEEHYN